MIRKPKWYQSVTEKTLVSDSSNNSVEKEIKKIPTLYVEPGRMKGYFIKITKSGKDGCLIAAIGLLLTQIERSISISIFFVED